MVSLVAKEIDFVASRAVGDRLRLCLAYDIPLLDAPPMEWVGCSRILKLPVDSSSNFRDL